MHAPSRRPAHVALLGFALVACAAPSMPAPSSGGSSAPSSSEAAANCQPIELLTPAGNRLDLTGTWRGSFGIHYIRQQGSCVWWVAEADDRDGNPTQGLALFRGMIHSATIDGGFTLTGEWMSVIRSSVQVAADAGHGSVTFRIEFEPAIGGETITLVSTTPEGMQGGLGPYAGMTLTYVGPLPPRS